MQTTTNLNQLAIDKTYEWIAKANAMYGINIPHVPVDFKLRGTTAGKARCSVYQPRIQYQPVILSENPDTFIKRTVPHEVAHIVVVYLYGNGVKPHGREWKSVMHRFGVDSSRCHSYDVSTVRQKRSSLNHQYAYDCGCKTYQLTIIRHRRILKGAQYRCNKCKGVLKPV